MFIEMAEMVHFRVLSISLSIVVSGSSSVGSDSESLLTCSKFHFEEKVLEKLVRLEHKMEINEEKLKRWEDTFYSKLDIMDAAIKQTEIFVETVRETYLQEQSRLNDSNQKIVENFKIRSENDTELYGEQINAMLESMSSKIEEVGVAEKKRHNAMELMQYTLHQEQIRFNQSFDDFLENTRLRFNKTIDKLFAKQQKVAVTACVSSSKTFSESIVRFSNVNFQVGIDNIDKFKSSGKFVCEIPGLYYISAHLHTNNKSFGFYVKKNGISIAVSVTDRDNTHSTNPISAVVELQLQDTLYVHAGCYIYGTYSCLSIMKVK